MRILLVSHLFPPAHNAGTEQYCLRLGQELSARGHEVTVFCTDKDIAQPDLELNVREHGGLTVYELTNNLFYDDFRATWDHPEIDAVFESVLGEVQPELVHFQHLMYLSAGCLELAKQSGCAVLFTLHDFWLQCPRFGQLVHPEGTICHVVDHARCGTCLPSFKFSQSRTERRTGKLIASMRAATGVDLGPLARGAARVLTRKQRSAMWVPPDDSERAHFRDEAAERSAALMARASACVDRFVSPSAFLREHFINWGLAPDQIVHIPTGLDLELFAQGERSQAASPQRRLRIAFIGTLVPLKGAHVLLEAWSLLSVAERGKGELRIFGPTAHEPDYGNELAQRAAQLGVELGGVLSREEVAATLQSTDLLVVPSLWYENRPLVLLEAFGARTPVLVSDLGGMAELVQEGRNGWRFPVGHAAALAQKLRSLLVDPSALDELYQEDVPIPSWGAFTDATEALYDEVRAQTS